jgi:hypothetical protein
MKKGTARMASSSDTLPERFLGENKCMVPITRVRRYRAPGVANAG